MKLHQLDLKRVAAVLGGAVLLALILTALGWSFSLAVKGAQTRLVPHVAEPRRLEHAVVIRERSTGRYLVYTEMEVKVGDLLITPDRRTYRVVRVAVNTAWADEVGAASVEPGGR